MKHFLMLSSALIIFGAAVQGQSIDVPQINRPYQSNKSVLPFIGVSIAIPLLKKYKQPKIIVPQSGYFSKPEPPFNPDPIWNGAATNEDGPIAWETTGQEVTIYVPRNDNNSGGGYYGGNYGSGGGSGPPHDQDQPGNPADTGGGGSDDNHNGVPWPLWNARKVDKDYCMNGKSLYKVMYEAQAARDKEQLALLTDKGVFWLDDVANTHKTSQLGKANMYELNSDGTRSFTADGIKYKIVGIVHTHPTDGGPGMSDGDLEIGQDFKVPIYAIHQSGIWKGVNGVNSIVDYNMQNIFNYSLANNVLQYY